MHVLWSWTGADVPHATPAEMQREGGSGCVDLLRGGEALIDGCGSIRVLQRQTAGISGRLLMAGALPNR